MTQNVFQVIQMLQNILLLIQFIQDIMPWRDIHLFPENFIANVRAETFSITSEITLHENSLLYR
jgi:hypothetical protein